MNKNKKKINHLYRQIFLVFVAFAMTIVLSLLVIVFVINGLLKESSEKTLYMVEANIDNTIANIETMFAGTLYNVVEQINAGRDNEHILQSLIKRNNLYSSTITVEITETGFYGFIRGEYLDGSGWVPEADYVPQTRPWYVDAVAAQDKPVVAIPYLDAKSGKLITGVSQAIYNNKEEFQGVLSIDASLDKLSAYIKAFQHGEDDEYVVLINQNREVLTHINTAMIGKDYSKINPRLIPHFKDLDDGTDEIIAKKIINSANENAIFSMKKTRNGWYLITAVAESSYYFLVYEVAAVLIIIGMLGFLFTAYVLLRFNKQRQSAVDANIGKTAFLARMSHELRTPLNAINGFAEIESRKKHCNEDTNKNVMEILTSGNNLLRIINDILDISKIEAEKIVFYPSEYDSATVINDIMNMNKIQIEESKNICLKLTIADNVPKKLFGDEIRVKQVINNILSNAIKYTEKGEISVSFSAEPLKNNNCKLIVDIKDTGIGIRKEDQSKLFEEYTRFDNERNQKISGTGLGLYITQKLAREMGGDIKMVKSEYGVGSHFRIIINQVIRSEKFIPAEIVEQLQFFNYARSNTTGTIKAVDFVLLHNVSVLVVDDVQINLDVIAGMMQPYGMTVDKLLSGVDALKLIESGCEKYDILFIDHMMPVMDGIECVSKIRSIDSEYARAVPIIAFTANAVVGMEEEFLAAGFSGFISKPINTVKLDEIIHEFIDESKFSLPAASETTVIRLIRENKDKIKGINFSEGIKKFNGNFDIYLRIFNSFINNIPEKLSQIIISPDENNLKNYGITVHGIKGSCYGISANIAGDKAFELEILAKENNIDEIRRLNPEFIRTIEELIADLKEFVDSKKPAKEKAQKPDTKLLQTLLAAAKDYNSEEMQKTIDKLNAFDYEFDCGFIAVLKGHINAFNYDATIEITEGYLETQK